MAIFGYPLAPHFNNSADATVTTVKNDTTLVGHIEASNINANEDLFLQLFDARNADVKLGTTTPKYSLLLPTGNGTLRGALDQLFVNGLIFHIALSYAVTKTPTGATGPTTPVTVNIGYIA